MSARSTAAIPSSVTRLAFGLTIRTARFIVRPTMPRIDHVAVESPDPARCAAFYERFLSARIVRTEGHPLMAYVQSGAIAVHDEGGPGTHIAFRVSEQEREALRTALDEADIEHEERDHGI